MRTQKFHTHLRPFRIHLLLVLFLCLMAVVSIACSSPTSPPLTTPAPAQTTLAATPTPTSQAPTEAKDSDDDSPAALSGQELVDELMAQMHLPEKLYIEARTHVDDMVLETKLYLFNAFMRYESLSDTGHHIMIYNPDEGITYQYSEDEGFGFIYRDDDLDEDETFEEDFDFSGEWYENIDGLTEAYMTTLNGKEVLYIETRDDSEGSLYIHKQWISLDYWHALKTESYYENQLVYSYEVIQVSTTYKDDPKLFIPPDHIQFMDMNSMFDGIFDLPGGDD